VEASETRRWLFEPKAEGEEEPTTGVRASETDALDDGWTDDPPASAPPPSSGASPDVGTAVAKGEAPESVVAVSPPAATVVAKEPVVALEAPAPVAVHAPEAVVPPVMAIAEARAEPASVEPDRPLPVVELPSPVTEPPRGRVRWVAVAALLLVAGAAGAWWHRSTAGAVVATSTTPTPAAPGTSTPDTTATAASGTAAAAPAPSTSAHPPEVASAPAPTASAPEPQASFDAKAAKHALDATAKTVANCRRGKTFGAAKATVTFGNDGAVSACVLGASFAGTPAGACVSEALSEVHVPPFRGKPGVVVHRFAVSPKHVE
jgi:hypothetical protein